MIPSLLASLAFAQDVPVEPASTPDVPASDVQPVPADVEPDDVPVRVDEPVPTREVDPYDGEVTDVISKFNVPLNPLTERTIGAASKPVAFNWRRARVQVGVTGSFLMELNNFDSARGGLIARFPLGGPIFELSTTWVGVWNTPSSELLALTPYRQPGRPSRLEVDLTVGYPIAEGVVTTFPRFIPALQLVFNFYTGLRYLIYPTGWVGMRTGEVAGAIFSPGLSEKEIDNLDSERLASMRVDPGRYGLMMGLGNDIYVKSGFFVSPRLMIAVPILKPASGTELGFWGDLSLAIGHSF